jgi:quinol monooxygenase YgiN
MYGVHGYFIAKPTKKAELLVYLLEASRGMEQVEENYLYIVSTSNDHPDQIYVYEVWRSKDDHQASLRHQVFQKLIYKAKPLIQDMVSYPDLDVVGGKGLPISFHRPS